MAKNNRLMKEFADLMASPIDCLVGLEQENCLKWMGRVLPTEAPFNKGSFAIQLNFPTEYPFKPPEITVVTPIYHPNIDENGKVCLPLIDSAHWKPNLKVRDVVIALVALIGNPQPDHPLRADVAELLMKHPKRFNKKVEESIKKYAPRDC